jgi:hypothetical protein
VRLSVVGSVVVVGLLSSCSGSSHRGVPVLTSVPAPPSTAAATSSVPAPSSSAVTVTTSVAAPGAPERCRTSTVGVGPLDTRTAAGHGLNTFEMRNTSGLACRVSGYPAVELLDAQGRVLAQGQPRGGAILGDKPPAPVTIAPGGAAYFAVESENVCPDDQPGSSADRLRVVLPDDAAPAVVSARITVCPRPDILVSPVRATQAELGGR